MVLPCGPRFPGANYVAQAAVKVMEILLLQPSECWGSSAHHHAQLSLFSMHGSPCFWSREIVSSVPMEPTFRGEQLSVVMQKSGSIIPPTAQLLAACQALCQGLSLTLACLP